MDASLQDLLDAISEPAALVDDTGTFIRGNAAYASATAPPEVRPEGAVAIAAGPQADRARESVLAALRGAPRATADYAVAADPPAFARLEAARLTPGVALVRYRDVTAERRAADESARVAARLDAVLEASSDAMITSDAAGRILAANRAVSTLFGYEPETLVGRDIGLLMPADESERHDRYIESFLATGHARIIGRERIVQGRRADGDVFPVRLTVREAAASGERIFVGLIRDVSDAERAREALDRSAVSFELALEAGRLGSFDVEIACRTIRADDRFRAVFGFQADAALSCAEVADRLHPDDRERLVAQVRGAQLRGAQLDFEGGATRLDGAERAIAIRGKVVQRADGAHIVGVVGDITERKEADAQRLREERDRYVIGEMRHRIKNLFTMVGAILNLSVRGHDEALPFKRAVEQRIAALEAAQARLAASGWRSSQLADIVATELEPFRDRRRDITVSGCDMTVNGHAAQILAMIVHELTTNAAKHGALSAPAGRVRVDCGREDDMVVLTWREEDGPPVAEPAHCGFGTTVLGRMAERFLDAEVEVRFAKTGFVYRLAMPAERVLEKH